MFITRLIVLMFAVGMMVLGAGRVYGQDYPNKPIRIMTGGIGGGADFTARLVAQGLTGPLGQPVIVDNRPSILGTEIAAKAPPDGYTLLVTGNSVWTRPLLSKVSWDAVSDFAPVSLIERVPYVVTVNRVSLSVRRTLESQRSPNS